MSIYCYRSDDIYCKYEGQSLEIISTLLTELGLTATIISKEEYETFLATQEL